MNASGGLLDRELRLRLVDGSMPPSCVADEVDALVSAGAVEAVVGWHISAVRLALAPRVAMRVPYVYTALYEGGENTAGVFMTGETPEAQLRPAMEFLARERGVRRWSIVGNDYVWPRRTAPAARHYAELAGGEVCDELFVPLGTKRYVPAIGRVLASRADGVLMLLVGEDAARFNRAFADVGLDDTCCRLSTLVDENTLLASGADATRGVYATAAYFESLVTPASLGFEARYVNRFGPDAPTLNSPGESCYEGILLLTELARRAGSLEPRAIEMVAGSVEYESPRGDVRLDSRHLKQRVYLAEADGLGFDVLAQV